MEQEPTEITEAGDGPLAAPLGSAGVFRDPEPNFLAYSFLCFLRCLLFNWGMVHFEPFNCRSSSGVTRRTQRKPQ